MMVAPISVIVDQEAGNSTNVSKFLCFSNKEVRRNFVKSFLSSDSNSLQGSAAVILSPALLGIITNLFIMILIIFSKRLQRYGI